jgi:O-antigen ligase
VLLTILILHVVRFARVSLVREALIYACFLGYMLLELLWTSDRQLALNTLVPVTNFVIILVLFSSLAIFHDLKSVLEGVVCGFIVGAALYTSNSGFPFRYPAEFSYNAIAGMYLFGFVVTLLLATMARRQFVLLALSAVIAIHIVATTSIKTNLGILLGALVAAAVHRGQVSRVLWRHALVIVISGVAVGFAVASNEAAVKTLQRGADRIALGIQVLQAREDIPGYSAFERRTHWQREGFKGWASNPVFGHGVEAFRSRFGITSHASHVDIAYNSGLIGLALFYGVFASVLLRLYRTRQGGFQSARIIILGTVFCLLFMTFSGTLHYGAFLAAFLALSIGILKRA